MATAGLALPEPAGLDAAREAGLRIRPGPQAGGSQIATSWTWSAQKDRHRGNLAVQNWSLSRHPTLYAVVALGLSFVATTLVLVALLLF